MQKKWITALASLEANAVPFVIVTVVEEKGSTPRNSGAKMLVSATEKFDTIGGGHLEYKAIDIARQLLAENATASRLERFSLSASLGQCCGGGTTLLFEPQATDLIHIALFGAGHVGRALSNILTTLPCKLHWIDSRETEFPTTIDSSVKQIISDDPVAEVSNLPANTYFIVMTHNHQLDLELTEAILKRDDYTYFGLIGSLTKRKKFVHRLTSKGFTDKEINKMCCPMGLEPVKGKLPAEIAVSVAAEIIAQYNVNFEHNPAIKIVK